MITASDSGDQPNRRGFLRASGTAAGFILGGHAGDTTKERAPETDADLGFAPNLPWAEPGLDHVVVLMFENRSFDHILGWLYPGGSAPEGQTFAEVPSQTFCNRSCFHASTSHGFVTIEQNGGFSKWLTAPPAPTLFNRLEEADAAWRVYYDDEQVVSLTGMISAPALEKYWKTHFRGMTQFYDDAR